MDADTVAVLEPETHVGEQALPEAETAAPPTAETEDSKDQTETEATLTREEADQLVAEARKETEAQLKAEAKAEAEKTIRAQRLSQIANDRNGRLVNDLNGLLEWVEKELSEGREIKGRVDQGYLARLAQRVDGLAFQEQHELREVLEDQLLSREIKGFDPSREAERALVAARAAGDPQALVVARFNLLKEAALAKARQEWEAELKDEDGTQKLKDAEAKRKAQPKPTNVAGAGTAGARTPRQILDDPNSSVEARKKALFAETGYQL